MLPYDEQAVGEQAVGKATLGGAVKMDIFVGQPARRAIVLATPVGTTNMKLRFPLLVLPFGSLIAINCGVRTPLDSFADDASGGSGGNVSNSSRGGSSGGGGRSGTGGVIFVLGGSTYYNTGGSIYAGGGYHVDGGASGGFAGNAGGSAGSVVLGGRGGAPNTGGMSRTGGIANTGGSAGGSAGTIGRDAGPDALPDLIIRDLGNDLRDTGRDSTGGAISTGGTGGVRATGGAIGSGGAIGPDAGACAGLAPNEELIDDLNDGDRFLPAISGRAGAWFDSHDSSPKGTMSPDPSTGFVPTNAGDSCRKYAAYVSGSGYVLSGASFWFGIGSPYNASKYTGISFWGKIDPGTSSVLRVAFPDKDTDPDGNLCSTASNAGSNMCYDHYGYRVTLTSTWTKYTITFSQLAQESWGRLGNSFDPATLYQVLFTIPVGATFGIWIDDIAFTF